MRLSGKLRWSINDTLMLAGVGMAFWGMYLWWQPLAWMICGIFLVLLSMSRESSGE